MNYTASKHKEIIDAMIALTPAEVTAASLCAALHPDVDDKKEIDRLKRQINYYLNQLVEFEFVTFDLKLTERNTTVKVYTPERRITIVHVGQ